MCGEATWLEVDRCKCLEVRVNGVQEGCVFGVAHSLDIYQELRDHLREALRGEEFV